MPIAIIKMNSIIINNQEQMILFAHSTFGQPTHESLNICRTDSVLSAVRNMDSVYAHVWEPIFVQNFVVLFFRAN